MKPDSRIPLALVLALSVTVATGCGKTTDSSGGSEDTSASGMAAESVGGALSNSSGSGTVSMNRASSTRAMYAAIMNALLPEANAANPVCPTLKTASGAGCTNGSNVVTLAYNGCSFGASPATWSGNLQIGASGIVCGSFPNPASITQLTRQFVDAGGAPASGSRTSALGTVVTIDHKTANLANFNNDTIAANVGSGYGTAVTFSGGVRTGVQVRQHVSSTAFDHSIDGSVSISEAAGSTNRVVTGSVKVYHNKVKVIGTSTFNNVTFSDGCCQPTAGSITTSFASTALTGAVGQALNGKTETLTFTGCGTGTLAGTDGSSVSVTLSHCL